MVIIMYHVRDGILGLAIGNAMGVPTTNNSREDLLEKPVTKMVPRIRDGVPKGAWSDSTSLTIATMSAISISGIDCQVIADNFVKWFTTNQFCSMKESFGIGETTLKALVHYTQHIEKAEECGLDGIMDNGNGSLIRMLPIAYYAVAKKCSDKEVVEVVRKVSSITHAHEISICGCYIYVRYVMCLLKGINKFSALNQIKGLDYSMFTKTTLDCYHRILKEDIHELEIDDIQSTAYIVDSLEASLWCFLQSASFKECVIATTNIGEATDSIGAIAGSLAGIFYGYANIPSKYLDDLKKLEYLEDCCNNYESYLKRL